MFDRADRGGSEVKWNEPKLHDLSDLRNSVAEGACSAGATYDPLCNVGAVADSCTDGGNVGGSGGTSCEAGSAA